jgi:hypothetical protein
LIFAIGSGMVLPWTRNRIQAGPMDATRLRHAASATETALAQIELAAVAVQATGQGRVPQPLQKDIADLMDVHARLSRRLVALRGVEAQVA